MSVAGCASPPREGHEIDDQDAYTFMVHVPAAETVHIVGSFNQWEPGELALHRVPDDPDFWRIRLQIPPGEHQFGYLVRRAGEEQAEWMTPPNAFRYVPDGFGHLNAVVEGRGGRRGAIVAGSRAVPGVEIRAAASAAAGDPEDLPDSQGISGPTDGGAR